MKNRIYVLSLLLIISCQSSIIISSNRPNPNAENAEVTEIAEPQGDTNENVREEAPRLAYQYRLTARGKLLIVPETILFEQKSGRLDASRYGRTIIYVSSLLGITNIMNIIAEGHIDGTGSESMNALTYDLNRTNNILYLYDRRQEEDLSYARSKAVTSSLTNSMDAKLINVGLQNLLNPYEEEYRNRRVEFIIIENTNDMNIYNDYIMNLFAR